MSIQKTTIPIVILPAALGCFCPKSPIRTSKMQAKKADIRTAIRKPLPLNPPKAVPKVHTLSIISKITVNTNIIIFPKPLQSLIFLLFFAYFFYFIYSLSDKVRSRLSLYSYNDVVAFVHGKQNLISLTSSDCCRHISGDFPKQ